MWMGWRLLGTALMAIATIGAGCSASVEPARVCSFDQTVRAVAFATASSTATAHLVVRTATADRCARAPAEMVPAWIGARPRTRGPRVAKKRARRIQAALPTQ